MIQTFTALDVNVMMQTIDARELIGIPNRFANQSTTEIEQAWKAVYRKLHHRGLLNVVNHEVKLEEHFANGLWIMSRTNLTVEIIRDGKQQSLFYFGTSNVVECSQVAPDQYTLYMHGTPQEVWNQVIYPRMLVEVKERIPTTDHSFVVPSKQFNMAVDTGEPLSIAELQKRGQDVHSIKAVKQFNHALRQPYTHNRFMMFYKQKGTWSIEGMHVIAAPIANWGFHMKNINQEEVVEGKQCSNLEIVTDVIEVMRRTVGMTPSYVENA